MPVLYQEVLDSFYIISKKLNMSITGPIIANLFDNDDVDADDKVQVTVFVRRLTDFVRQHDT